MPTPRTGFISVSDLEKEFGIVDGSPSGIAEYTGRTGSFAGTSLGVQGVSTSGEIAFSQLRDRTAHATPELVINTLFKSFGTEYRKDYVKIQDGIQVSGSYTIDPIFSAYYKLSGQNHDKFLTGTGLPWQERAIQPGEDEGIIRYVGNDFKHFPFGMVNATTDGNIPNTNHTTPQTTFRTGVMRSGKRIPSPFIDENVHACLDNTLVYLATGKCKYIGDYGTGTSGTTPVTSRLRIEGFNFNGRPVNPQDESVALTWGVDHGIGAGGGKYNSFGRTVKTCMAVYNTGSVNLTNCVSAYFTAGGAFWNGNLGSRDSDTMYQKFMLLIPNRWKRISSTLHPIGTGQMTLEPGDIAIVTNAANTPLSVGNVVTGFKRDWAYKFTGVMSIFRSSSNVPRGARIISRQEFESYYGSILSVDVLPEVCRTKQVTSGRTKKTVRRTLSEALDAAFSLFDYYELAIDSEINPYKMLWAPIVNRTLQTDRFLPAMFYSSTSFFGMSCIGVYGNYYDTTITCDLATSGFAPYVSIFRFVGDGYMTSRKQVPYPGSVQSGIGLTA